MRLNSLCLAAILALGLQTQLGAVNVVIIGCDGLSPDGIRKARTPHLDRMMREGAYTLHARGVMPTSSSPNWASMIMGAGPEQHGVTSNEWKPDKYEIAPVAKGTGGIFPTIFGELRAQHPAAVMGVFHDWSDFGRLFERAAVNRIEDSVGPTNAVLHALDFIREQKPVFTFIHLDHVDHAGHQAGHGTAEYYQSVESADGLIGQVLSALDAAGIMKETVVLVTSDHGGKGKGHGGATMEELEIPWIIHGAGIRQGHELKTPVNTYDTAVTVAHILNVKPHAAWIGKSINEAFVK